MIKLVKSIALTAILLAIPVAHAATETNQTTVEQKSTAMPEQPIKVTSWADYAQKKAALKEQKKSKAITRAEFKEKKKELKMAYKAHKKDVKEDYKAKEKALKEDYKAKRKALKEEYKALKAKEKAEKKELKEKMRAEKKDKSCHGKKKAMEKAS
jgi:hypothetical protein